MVEDCDSCCSKMVRLRLRQHDGERLRLRLRQVSAAAATRAGETTAAALAASAVRLAASAARAGATAAAALAASEPEGLLEGQRLQRRPEQPASEDLLGASAPDASEGLVEGHGASVASSHHQREARTSAKRSSKQKKTATEGWLVGLVETPGGGGLCVVVGGWRSKQPPDLKTSKADACGDALQHRRAHVSSWRRREGAASRGG